MYRVIALNKPLKTDNHPTIICNLCSLPPFSYSNIYSMMKSVRLVLEVFVADHVLYVSVW